ncbi:MAG: phosphatidate cytidylyltransferase [Candidatus Acidiferrales bacterium]
MLRRILTAAVAIPIVVLVVWWAPSAAIAAVAALVLLLALDEFFRLADRLNMRAYRFWTMLSALGLIYAQWCAGAVETRKIGPDAQIVRNLGGAALSIDGVLLIFVLGVAIMAIGGRRAVPDIVPAVASSSAALLFVALPFSYLVRLVELERYGRQLVLFALALVWAGDMLAYFIGKFAGHIPLAPVLSPKKTWEGAAANVAASLIVAILFARWMQMEATPMLVVAACANVAGQLGDLIESAYKRGAGVKDSGSILPGHGGMLDRIDSLILAAPAVWWTAGWFLRTRG